MRTRRVGSAFDHGMTSWRSASVSRAVALVPAEPPAFSFLGAPDTEARLGGDAGRNVLASIPPTSISVGEDDPGASRAPAASRSRAADRVSIAARRGVSPPRPRARMRKRRVGEPFNKRLYRP